MLAVTEAAGKHLVGLLSEAEAPDDAAIRVVVANQGLALRIDHEQEGDKTFEHDGRTVLLLDDKVSEVLSDHTLDIEQAGEGPRLTIR